MSDYYMTSSVSSYDVVLIVSAALPALLLMLKVYRADRLESESSGMLWRLVIAGVLSSLVALVEERILITVLNAAVTKNYALYMFLLYFVIVAYAEESSKYLLLKRNTWNSPEFNCQYDGVVYAVFVSLGFALWENISYVMTYGFRVAIVRALTAIPGHACFGVFMGCWYAQSYALARQGNADASKLYRVLSVLLPALLHGAYDYLAVAMAYQSTWYFLGFVAVLFLITYRLIVRLSREDRYI